MARRFENCNIDWITTARGSTTDATHEDMREQIDGCIESRAAIALFDRSVIHTCDAADRESQSFDRVPRSVDWQNADQIRA